MLGGKAEDGVGGLIVSEGAERGDGRFDLHFSAELNGGDAGLKVGRGVGGAGGGTGGNGGAVDLRIELGKALQPQQGGANRYVKHGALFGLACLPQ